jgi:photosystem II stability/assembly factor-like uncharacterized protein
MTDLEGQLRQLGEAIVPRVPNDVNGAGADLLAVAERRRRVRQKGAVTGVVVVGLLVAGLSTIWPPTPTVQHVGVTAGTHGRPNSATTTTATVQAEQPPSPDIVDSPTTPTLGGAVIPKASPPDTVPAGTPSSIPTPTSAPRSEQCDPASFGSRAPLHFASIASQRWAVFGNSILAMSADSGRTWTQRCFDTQRLEFYRLTAVSTTHLFATAATVVPGKPSNWTVVESSDSGDSWTVVSGIEIGPYDYIVDFAFTGAAGWLYGGTRTSSSDGFSAALWRTTDAGAHWRSVVPPNPSAYISSMSFSDGKHGWLLTNDSRLFHTADGGDSWSESRLPPTATGGFRSVAAMDTYVYLATTSTTAPPAANSNSLLASNDGGESWIQTPADAWRVVALANGTAVAIGHRILRTTNGGRTWTEPALPGEDYTGFESIIRDGSLLWVTGQRGALSSEDAGATWKKFDVPLR